MRLLPRRGGHRDGGADGRPAVPRVPVRRGERVLAGAVVTGGGAAVGTRDALYLAPPTTEPAASEPVRLAWEEIEAADWDADEELLRVVPVGSWGEVRAEHSLALEGPERLLQLVRERVTASIVVQRHVPVADRRGLRVVARRAPSGGPVRWFHEYDAGIDPADPAVARVAEEALAAAREEVGDAG